MFNSGMEGDLLRMFQHMDLGQGKQGDFMAQIMRRYEIGILQAIRTILDARIKEISRGQQPLSDEMNPFVILGVGMDASEAEVRAAYRRKAYDAHPDHGGSNEDMARVNAAFEVIRQFRGWKK